MSCERALYFEQLKTFAENYTPMREFDYLLRIIVACNFSPSSFKLKRGILPLCFCIIEFAMDKQINICTLAANNLFGKLEVLHQDKLPL